MRSLLFVTLVSTALAAPRSRPVQAPFDPESIVRLEQAALARWGNGDPGGYLEMMAPDVTYFDPTTERRIDGAGAVTRLVEPLRGKLHIDRSEMLNPSVAREGNTAVLTFNLISHGGRIGDGPRADVRWNSTEIYRFINGRWTIVHSHWSHTKPEPKPGA